MNGMKSVRAFLLIGAAVLLCSCNLLMNLIDDMKSNEGSSSNPFPIVVGTTHTGKIGATDTSYYGFTVLTSGTYNVACANVSPSGTDLDFAVYVAGSSTSSLAADSSAGNSGISSAYLPIGSYRLEISNGTGSQAAIYDLTVTLLEAGPPNEGSVASPVALSVGSVHAGKVGSYSGGTDNSYYCFSVATAGNYTITCSNTVPSGSDMDFYLYSNSGFTTLITSSYSNFGIPSRSYTVGTYYLRVENNTSATVTYDLTVAP